jgi:hypothetical protein
MPSVRTLIALLVGVVALGAGVLVGYKLDSGEDSASAAPTSGLPAAVEETRAELLAAAESGDYEALTEHISADGFEYTFGSPVEGGPVAYWQELERTTDERPLEALAAILKMPYALSRGFYYWPWAHAVGRAVDLSPHEREVLAPLGAPTELFPEGSGYFGWRTAIAPDGTWVFFVAGD